MNMGPPALTPKMHGAPPTSPHLSGTLWPCLKDWVHSGRAGGVTKRRGQGRAPTGVLWDPPLLSLACSPWPGGSTRPSQAPPPGSGGLGWGHLTSLGGGPLDDEFFTAKKGLRPRELGKPPPSWRSGTWFKFGLCSSPRTLRSLAARTSRGGRGSLQSPPPGPGPSAGRSGEARALCAALAGSPAPLGPRGLGRRRRAERDQENLEFPEVTPERREEGAQGESHGAHRPSP